MHNITPLMPSRPCPRCKASEERVTPIHAFGCDQCGAIFTDCTPSSDLPEVELCDVCAGEGTPLSGGVCICGGSGKAQDAVPALRNRVVDLTVLNHRLYRLLREARHAYEQDTVEDWLQAAELEISSLQPVNFSG